MIDTIKQKQSLIFLKWKLNYFQNLQINVD